MFLRGSDEPSNMSLQVSITGEPGCGKTTVARLVAQELRADYMSTGSIQREIAAKLGITTLELNKRAETDPSIDQQVDAHTQALGNSGRAVLVDSRLAWRFLPRSLKVFLVCPPSVAAVRVFQQQRANESYASKEQAIAALIARYDSEKARFAKYYGANLANLRNYDLVIDTSLATPQQICDAVVQAAHSMGHSHAVTATSPLLFVSPRSLIPTLTIAQVDSPQDQSTSSVPVQVVRQAQRWAVVHGHHWVIEQIKKDAPLMLCQLIGQDDELLSPRVTVRSLIEDRATPSNLAAWESHLGFKLP
jgi:CMP/dCMP kinase